MTPFSLAEVFRDLANDPSWPWRIQVKGDALTMARLAIMVIEQKHKWTLDEVKNFEQIKKDYANVKKRVEEADSEEGKP